MDRNRAIQLLVVGDKVLTAYDGATSAWNGMGFLRTGAETLTGKKPGLAATMAIIGACMGVILLPTMVRKVKTGKYLLP